jgi:molecular chaperone DnaJ
MSHSTETNNHYHTLGVHYKAAQSDIKRAYRELVKKYHPDCNRNLDNHDRIAAVNNAYEVLSNPQSRATYDRSIGIANIKFVSSGAAKRAKRATSFDEEELLEMWIEQVYEPITGLLSDILDDLDDQIDRLADDPFDDELMDNFQTYLEECHNSFTRAQIFFRGIPNPSCAASVATNLYHCLNVLDDGIEEFRFFTLNFDDQHLHTAQELWRRAEEMRSYAQASMQNLRS